MSLPGASVNKLFRMRFSKNNHFFPQLPYWLPVSLSLCSPVPCICSPGWKSLSAAAGWETRRKERKEEKGGARGRDIYLSLSLSLSLSPGMQLHFYLSLSFPLDTHIHGDAPGFACDLNSWFHKWGWGRWVVVRSGGRGVLHDGMPAESGCPTPPPVGKRVSLPPVPIRSNLQILQTHWERSKQRIPYDSLWNVIAVLTVNMTSIWWVITVQDIIGYL